MDLNIKLNSSSVSVQIRGAQMVLCTLLAPIYCMCRNPVAIVSGIKSYRKGGLDYQSVVANH